MTEVVLLIVLGLLPPIAYLVEWRIMKRKPRFMFNPEPGVSYNNSEDEAE